MANCYKAVGFDSAIPITDAGTGCALTVGFTVTVNPSTDSIASGDILACLKLPKGAIVGNFLIGVPQLCASASTLSVGLASDTHAAYFITGSTIGAGGTGYISGGGTGYVIGNLPSLAVNTTDSNGVPVAPTAPGVSPTVYLGQPGDDCFIIKVTASLTTPTVGSVSIIGSVSYSLRGLVFTSQGLHPLTP